MKFKYLKIALLTLAKEYNCYTKEHDFPFVLSQLRLEHQIENCKIKLVKNAPNSTYAYNIFVGNSAAAIHALEKTMIEEAYEKALKSEEFKKEMDELLNG